MKLYTEEQVKKIIFNTKQWSNLSNDYLIATVTPIELPSDEEILESSPHKIGGGNYNPLANFHRYEGAKWMKEQILNQNK